MFEDRNVRTRDNRRGSGRSELPPQTAKIVIDLRRPYRAKHESGSILENTPDLRVERFSASDLLLRLEERAVCGVELSYRGRASCGISPPEYLETGSFPLEDQVYRSSQIPPAQNIPFGLARGMFGAINGAEFFGSPTSCKVSQCSIALPSASSFQMSTPAIPVSSGSSLKRFRKFTCAHT